MRTIDPGDPRVDRDAFLKARQPYFTASNTSVLFARHPFTTAADYWLEKTVGTHQEETKAMRRGQHLESAILGWYGDEYGRRVDPSHLTYIVGQLAATPDGWTNELPIEIKTTNEFTGDTPQQYWLDQCQTQMICTETDMAILIWMDAALELHMIEVDADPVLQAEIVTKANAFMEAVEAQLMPDWIELEARHIIAMYPKPTGSIDGDIAGMSAVHEYWLHKQAENFHKDRAAAARDRIAELMSNYDTLSYNGDPVATFKARPTPAGFDKVRLQTEHPGLFEEYTTPAGSTRVLNIPKRVKEQIENE